MNDTKSGKAALSVETILTHHGRQPDDQFGFVNTPVYRGSTVLFKTLDDMTGQKQRYLYGRAGNPTTESVEAVITELEGAHRTRLVPSGLAAITIAVLSCVKAGDDVLISDSAYEPGRSFADGFLKRMGVSARYYDPRIGAGISTLMQPNTAAVLAESPGSLTFEVQDIPALAAAAHANGARLIVDNSWASPLYHQPLALGADLVVHAGTKMFVGHSDAFAGTISTTEAAWPEVEGASAAGARYCRLARGPGRGDAGAAPRPAQPSRPCPVQARLHRLGEPVQRHAGPCPARGGGGLCRRARYLHHGIFLGRL